MLIEDAYRVIPVSPPAFSHLPSSSFLPQFPKNNNNNNRMPSVNIIEVWLPGRLLFIQKTLRSHKHVSSFLSPSACQDEAGPPGLSAAALTPFWHGT